MDIKSLTNNPLMGKTVGLLSSVLDYRAKNHAVISGNLSNIDTPGYKPKELTFDEALTRAVDKSSGLDLKRTDKKHLPVFSGELPDEPSFSVQTVKSSGDESADLDIDTEMAKMSQNNLLYEASVKMLSQTFESLRTAITGNVR